MNHPHKIILAGAGGIAEAAALLLAEWSETPPVLFIGDRFPEKARQVADWVRDGSSQPCVVHDFHLPESGSSEALRGILEQGDILLDCLPGSQAARMAALAKEFRLHYCNLTEHVSATNAIMDLAQDAETGFVLQTGLAPGYINVLAHGLFQQFCRDFGVEHAEKLEMKVGALTDHAIAPHYYGFTWSPAGVATEYVMDAVALRDYHKTALPALSERRIIHIDGIPYEEDLTSGGAADLPDALAGKVRTLDYKTLRYPGHYGWVQAQLQNAGTGAKAVAALQEKMEAAIPHIEDDRIVLYAAVEGRDNQGVLRRREIARHILPLKVGRYTLRAIQTTTAAPLLESAMMLLESNHRGLVLQSQIEPKRFLNGTFVGRVYGQ